MQAVIDLGEDWAPPADSERPLRQISPRVPLALLSLVLVALLGGSALPRYTMVSLFSVPLATNGAYAIGSDAVYTERDGEITGYRLPGGAREGVDVAVDQAGQQGVAASVDPGQPGPAGGDAAGSRGGDGGDPPAAHRDIGPRQHRAAVEDACSADHETLIRRHGPPFPCTGRRSVTGEP